MRPTYFKNGLFKSIHNYLDIFRDFRTQNHGSSVHIPFHRVGIKCECNGHRRPLILKVEGQMKPRTHCFCPKEANDVQMKMRAGS